MQILNAKLEFLFQTSKYKKNSFVVCWAISYKTIW